MSAGEPEPLSRGALVLIAGALALAGCGQSPPPPSDPAAARAVARSGPGATARDAAGDARDIARRATGRADGDAEVVVLMPSGLHADPDPRIRLQALEMWAMHPGPTRDPVTHALVDPDEAVRARAQELFEEALARR